MARAVLGQLPSTDLRKLGPKARQNLHATVRGLLCESDRAGLSYVPVFGYLSLITHNHLELGKTSQRQVINGVDVFPARLPGYAVTPVASTVFRGTPERPGLVAGLAASTGSTTAGVVLAVPKARVLELLPRLLQRELATENDLRPTSEPSALMYLPQLLPVTLQGGRSVRALVFTSDPRSPKSLHSQGFFQDTDNHAGTPSPGALAWMMSSRGRGASVDYWARYQEEMNTRRVPIDGWITQALEAATQPVSNEALEQLALRSKDDPAAADQLAALAERYAGAASVIKYRTQQRSNGPVRVDPVTPVPQAP